jgi:predicted alpha/beta superfamily hydrolase
MHARPMRETGPGLDDERSTVSDTNGAPSELERELAVVPSRVPLRADFWDVRPPLTLRGKGYEWEHEIRVALPASYAASDRPYPVLWITDNALEHALTALPNAHLILVGVGAGLVSSNEFTVRRTYDFTPAGDLYFDSPTGNYLREFYKAFPEIRHEKLGGAGHFLDFLVDEVRPALAAEYRMKPDDHCLLGFSQGGAFVGFSLFARPGAFAKYICGSPGMYAGNYRIFELEEEYAATHDDLPATVFFGAGEDELTEPLISSFGVVSAMARMVETLVCRRYPSLQLTAKIFPGESHATMLGPLIGWGVRTVFGEEIAGRRFYHELQRVGEEKRTS